MKDPPTSEINELKKKLDENPDSLVFAHLADAYRKQGNLDEGLAVCKKGLERHPSNTSGRVVLGRIYHQQGKEGEAASELKKALELDPDNLMAHSVLGSIYSGKKDYQAAIEEYQKILALNPDDEEAQSSLKMAIERAASGQRQEKPPKKEAPAPEKKTSPKETTATLTMAELYLKQGHLDDAAEVYQELLAADPQNFVLRQKLSEIVARRQKEDSEKAAASQPKKSETNPAPVRSPEGGDLAADPKQSGKTKKEDDSKFTSEDILQVMRRGSKDDAVVEEAVKPPTPKQEAPVIVKNPAETKPAAESNFRPEQLDGAKGVLAELSAVSGIIRCFLTGNDGIIVVSMGETSNNADLGKQTLAIFQSTRRSVSQLKQGKLQQVLVTAESGHILLVSFESHVLIVLANSKLNLGLLRLSLDSAVKKLDKIFST